MSRPRNSIVCTRQSKTGGGGGEGWCGERMEEIFLIKLDKASQQHRIRHQLLWHLALPGLWEMLEGCYEQC